MNKILFLMSCLIFINQTFSQLQSIIPIEQKTYEAEKAIQIKNPLLDNYDVCFYFIDLNATNLNKTISGKASIKAKVVNQPLNELMLQLHSSLTVDSVKIDNQLLSYSHTNNEIHIPINNPISENQYFTADIYYKKRTIAQLGGKNNMDTKRIVPCHGLVSVQTSSKRQSRFSLDIHNMPQYP